MSAIDDRWRTAWLRGGRISEVAWINQDVLAWCLGINLVFFDVPTNKLLLPRLSYDIVAAGASCLSGHPSPRIFIYTYPSLTRLCECTKGASSAYLATTFIGDFLVSLSSLPNFKLTFWLWRTGIKIMSIDTPVHDAGNYGQTLRTSFSNPPFIAQIGNQSSLLFTWEVIFCHKKIILNKTRVILPNKAVVKDVAWSPDSSEVLAIVDKNGCVYLSNPTGTEIKRIVLTQRCTICPELEPTAICWYQGGIVLRTTFCQMRYYKKDDNNLWRKTWIMKCMSSPCVLTSHPFRSDRLFFITVDGRIIQINYSIDTLEAEQEVKYFLRGKYLFIEFIQPWENHIVAVDDSMELSVIEIDKGCEVSKFRINIVGKIIDMVSHPHYPIIVVSSDKGEVAFVSYLHNNKPKILGKYTLQSSERLDSMKFSLSGRHLMVWQRKPGVCYLFTISYLHTINVRTRLETNTAIQDILLFELKDDLRCYMLQCSMTTFSLGNKIISYELLSNYDAFKRSSIVYGFSKYYHTLIEIPDKHNEFLSLPYLTQQLSWFQIVDWKEIVCTDKAFLGHSIRLVKLFRSKHWLITSGIDGLLTVRSLNVKISKNEYYFTHHRHESNIKKAKMNFAGNVLVTLGVNGSLVTLKAEEVQPETELPDDSSSKNFYDFAYKDFKYSNKKLLESLKVFNNKEIEFLSEPIHTYMDSEKSEITWVEWQKKQKLMEETKRYSPEKGKIIAKLNILKRTIIELLDKNETASEMVKLPMSVFALNKNSRERKIKSGKDECEELRRELESNCKTVNRVSNWLITEFWNTQKVLGQSICGIFDSTEVSNYTIPIPNLETEQFIEHSHFTHNVFKQLFDYKTLYPWEICNSEELKVTFTKQIRLRTSEEFETMAWLNVNNDGDDDDDDYDDDDIRRKEKNEFVLEGVTTFNFFEPRAPSYSQFKAYSFLQQQCDCYHINEETKKLRLYFNNQFNEMMSVKKREFSLIRERVDQLHHICSELQQMFNIIFKNVVMFPTWDIKEQPERIIQVTEDELQVKPYVSPSIVDLNKKQVKKEDNTEQTKIVSEFRDRTLQTMMDGMLETRWEDIIKIDPPKPTCMILGKRVEEYTEEDNLAVKRYEQTWKNLEIEREKYQKILQSDYTKIITTLSEEIKKFNLQLEGFHLSKIKVESSIQQLNLQYVRRYEAHLNRVYEYHNIYKRKREIEDYQESIIRMKESISAFESIDAELHSLYNSLTNKDKIIEKKFKNNFTSLGKTSLATLFTYYKRRPRIILMRSTEFEVLDLGKSIVAMENFSYLSPECLDYYNQLAHMDVRPVNLPSSIEAIHWQNLVVLRRLKIDHELKLRATEINLEKAAVVLANYNRKVEERRLGIQSIKEELRQSYFDRINRDLDFDIQLVVKMGQVEVELHGDLKTDMVGTIVVPRSDVEKVNDAILTAGNNKLRVIRRSLDFRRDIEVEQWHHDCVKMRIRHQEVALYFAKTATLTREIRDFLIRKSKGLKDDKTPQKLNRKHEAIRKSHEKLLKDYDVKLNTVFEEVVRVRKKNAKLDEKITMMNVKRCDLELQRDIEAEERHKDFKQKVTVLIAQKAAMVRKLLENYKEILEIRKEKDYKSCIPHPSIKYL